MSIRHANTVVSIIVLMTLLIQPLAAGAVAPTPQLHPTTALPPEPEQPAQGFLFRASVTLAGSRNLARLEKVGVLVLDTFDSNDAQTALVLADGEQLADLARLGYRPEAANELRLLVNAQGPEKRWLAEGLQPLLAQADAVTEQQATAGVAGATAAPDAAAEAVALQALRSSMRALTPEQIAAVASSSSVDDDADGLTNTQESWWCTDPMDTDTDDDGRTDGAEIQALKDWIANERASAPGETPWPSWPFNTTTCPDKDHDSIPNLVERWELGLNMDWESSDRDKFDDGQELFGATYCPGGDLNCGYGTYPRSEDSGFVPATMPSWVEAPGKHPLVAAFPVPEVDVVESSLHVETVTEVTTDHVIASGTEESYSTAKTEGTSTSVANTVTWNEWQEVSESLQQHVTGLLSANGTATPDATNWGKLAGGTLQIAAGVGTAAVGCGAEGFAAISTFGLGALAAWPLCAGGIATGVALVGSGVSDLGDAFTPDQAQTGLEVNTHETTSFHYNDNSTIILNQAQDTQSLVRAVQGTQYAYLQSGELVSQGLSNIAHILASPVRTTTNSQGKSWGGAQTTTSEQYEEHTITNGEAFSSEESWGNATAVDSAHSADLWFTYNVCNSGTEYAREIKHLAFNIYIGDNPDPTCTYHVGSTACGVPVDTVLFANFLPGEEHSYTSFRIPLTLNQMRDIDLGEPIRIVVEDFTYGADELFYEDAANAGVLLAMEDGTDDGDEAIDTYLIPSWGSEMVLDVLARYFPHSTDADGMLTAVWTPEYRADTPAWCVAPQVVGIGAQRTLWCKHALSTADWWNVYTDGMGDGSEGFQDTPASPGQVALFRFNKDSDLDGYSDRSEARLGTDPNDPADYPRPELLAGVHTIRSGHQVTATLSLLNTGLYDAYGVEAVMIAPNNTISITNNTVGGSGRVRAQKQVIVGSRIATQTPLPAAWLTAGHAQPSAGGYYSGASDRTYTFTVQCGNSGGCVVGTDAWTLAWNDGEGVNGSLSFDATHKSPTLRDIGAFGVKLGFLSGKVNNGEIFTVAANTPRDTFQYTIAAGHETDYTAPVVLVSFNDPQGNHRFVIPPAALSLSSPTDNLMVFSGQMLRDPGVEIVTSAAFAIGANTTDLVMHNPTEATLTDAHLFLEFIDPEGNVVSEVPMTMTLPAGPSVVPIPWDSGSFDPAYDPAKDYIVMAFWTDYQGNILDTAARPLSSFQEDPKPAFTMAAEDEAWDFGTVQQGTLMQRQFTLASVGYADLLTHLSSAISITVEGPASQPLPPGDMGVYTVTVNTQHLPVGPFQETIPVRTNDPENPTKDITILGNVTPMPEDAPGGATLRPLDWTTTVSGTLGSWVEFIHTLGPDPQTLHPVKVYSQDYSTLKGVGKYATDFGEGTASYDMFGDGRDGVMPSSGNLDNTNGVGVGIINSGSQGAYSITVTDAYAGSRINPGDAVLIHQTQGTGAGCWELNKAASDYAGGTANIQLAKALQCNYASGGSNHAQIQRVPQYTDCPVSGTVTPLSTWNGTWGGIFAVMCNATMTLTGNINANGWGFRGGARSAWPGHDYYTSQAEGTPGVGTLSNQPNGNGGGGGRGVGGPCGGGGGGGNGSIGSNGETIEGPGGYGGYTSSNQQLTIMTLGGGGGAGADSDNAPEYGGSGGSGGGAIFLAGRSLTISGLMTADGAAGTNASWYQAGAGGGGAGGSILVRSETATLGSARILARGGTGGSGISSPRGGNGGAGGSGRIRVEYCETPPAFTTNPEASTQKLDCYVVEQVESAPYDSARLNLPESGTHTYQVQYGRRYVFTGSGNQTQSIRMPKQLYATATMDALVSNTGISSGDLSLSLDIGGDGTGDWAYNNTTTFPISFTLASLANALNAYMVNQTGVAWGADIDVPMKLTINRQADVILTNLVLTLQSNQPSALSVAAVETGADRPLDWTTVITGSHSQGEPYTYTHTLNPDPESIHPCKVYDQSGNVLKGVGRYCSDFGNSTVSVREFGTGRDGDLVVASGDTFVDNVRTSLNGGVDAGAMSLPVPSTSGFSQDDDVLVVSSQLGTYEFATVAGVQTGGLLLATPLQHSYNRGLVPDTTCPAGYTGQYYTNNSFSGSPSRTQCDSTISFNWGTGGPSGLPSDNFSIRWTGSFHFSEGAYRFDMGSDDGGILYVDDRLVLQTSCCATRSATLALSEGTHTVRLDYMEYTGAAHVQLSISVGGAGQVVRVPNYRNVTVQAGGRLTAHAWDGSTGGIAAFRASEQLLVNDGASVSVSALGYAGAPGTNPTCGGGNPNLQGYSYAGTPLQSPATNFGGGGGGDNETGDNHGNYAGGGGGGHGSAGANGIVNPDPENPPANDAGQGGTTYGSADLGTIFLGSGGGQGGNDWKCPGGGAGYGGRGGGIAIVLARSVQLIGQIVADGQSGYPPVGTASAVGGGGGAGGSILIRTASAELGSDKVTAGGGPGGGKSYGEMVKLGGDGGVGRIRTEYCNSISGTTDPAASTQKLDCYTAEQVEQSPYATTQLYLPEQVTDGITYLVQYGRRFSFSGSGQQTNYLRVSRRMYGTASLDVLVSNTGVSSGNLDLCLDIGNDGDCDYHVTGSQTFPLTLSATGLADAFNDYLVGQAVPWGDPVDVPVRVQVDRQADVMLTNLALTPVGAKTRFLRLPARNFSDVRLDILFGETGNAAGPLAFTVDVGADGTVDWTDSRNLSYPATVRSPNLAAAFNSYLGGRTGEVDVPIRITPSPSLFTTLDTFMATPTAQPDATLGSADISFGATDPVEGDEVLVSATLHNTGGLDTGRITASFYATSAVWGEWYIGSAFVSNVPAGGTAQAEILWNTLGFTGATPVRVSIDPYNRLAETNEVNNEASNSLTIKTRPDLEFTDLQLSDLEPVAGETVTVTLPLRNNGQTTAGSQTVALYEGNPDAGGTQMASGLASALPGAATTNLAFAWTPATPGLYQLFARADRDRQVNEYDEGNNDAWRDVYVGFRSPIEVDSGSITSDVAYTTTLGYGAVDEGQADEFGSCGTEPWQTFRRDPDGRVVYQFDHLLPGHFYHLDLSLYLCGQAARNETVSVDGNLVAGPVSLGDGQNHRLSLRLDPALYADRAISVTVETAGLGGAIVNEVNLHDVDYRYSDAGGANDPAYSTSSGYGYLNGVARTQWGTLPYLSLRENQSGNTVSYRYDGLLQSKRYQTFLSFWQNTGSPITQKVQINGIDTGTVLTIQSGVPYSATINVPTSYYVEGTITVSVVRTDASTSAMVNEIAVEERTLLTLPEIRDVRMTNIGDTSASISWISADPADGQAHYGPTAALGAIGQDDRGAATVSRTHQVTLLDLTPQTTYYFYVTSADSVGRAAGNALYQFTTGPTLSLPASDLIYGQVFNPDNTPAAGALVYVTLRDADGLDSPGMAAPLSALVDAGGYWSLNLGGARTTDNQAPFIYDPAADRLDISATQGTGCAANLTTTTADDSPAASMTLACPMQMTHSLAASWNLIGLTVQSDPATAAEAALDDIVNQGGSAIEIERWWNGGWDAHVRDLPFNNFTLELGRGYFIRSSAASTWTRTGTPPTSPLPVELYPGWNLVSTPKLTCSLLAEDVLVAIATQGGACGEIDRWYAGNWQGHIKGLGFNNFAIATDQGYFVKCTQRSTYVPCQATAQSADTAWPPAVAPVAATPAPNPTISDVRVTNRRDVAFTVTWRTDRPSTGWVAYGTDGETDQVAHDDRGADAVSTLHHVTVTGLAPQTAYTFYIHSGKETADRSGMPFQVTTAVPGTPAVPLTAYGLVHDAAGQPTAGALVRAWIVDATGATSGPLSALSDGWGYWTLSLPAGDCSDETLAVEALGPDGAVARMTQPACAERVQPVPALTLRLDARRPVYLPLVIR